MTSFVFSKKDPVCGMTVDPGRAAGSFEYRGKSYYFCSRHCLERFRSDPDHFLDSQPIMMPPVGIHHASEPSVTDPVATTTPLPARGPQSAPGSAKSVPVADAHGFDNAKTTYTCPMHPQIVRDAPGSCPICGMALEPRTVSLEEETNPRRVSPNTRHNCSTTIIKC